ncbi:MAG: hypothetical protein KDA83_19250, partial [Planctomycetales bacterium]|nr:hypothetical protein [Planctomycetales bacterium]
MQVKFGSGRAWGVALAGVAALGVVVSASETRERRGETEQAEELVAEGLHFGLLGDSHQRDQRLEQALAADADCEAAHWAQGRVRSGDEWVGSVEEAERRSSDQLLTVYRARRDGAEDTIESQWELAQ